MLINGIAYATSQILMFGDVDVMFLVAISDFGHAICGGIGF